MRFDIWQTEREAAEVVEHGIRVQRVDTPPIARIWNPKATKPTAHYRFRSVEAREDYITRYLRNYAEAQATKAGRRESARGTAAQHAAVSVGTIFVYSWGYDQTQAEAWEIVEKSGSRVVLRELAQESVPGSQGSMSERVMPRPGVFLENGKPLTKMLQFSSDGEPFLSFDYGSGRLWRGESLYHSWYH